MTVVVTGATGHLGRLVVENLLERGFPADQIVATGRRVETLDDLAARGVTVRRADLADPESLDAAFAGARTVLLVSGNEFGLRVAQHTDAIEAAKRVGVGRVVYTSAPRADTTPMRLAVEHKVTEEVLRASGIPFTILRNNWYFENYTVQIPTYLQLGAVVGSAGEGRVNGASRADYAAAAATTLIEDGHENAVYELGGDESFSLADLAATVGAASGKEVVYNDVPVPALIEILVGAGFPEAVAAIFADVDTSIRTGALAVDSTDLRRLAGRPTTRLEDAVAAALAQDTVRA